MATKPNTAQTLAERKAVLDAQFHAGTKADRQRLMYANGLRKAREDKGYGRQAVAQALKITPAEWWVAEFVLVTGTPEHKDMVAKVAALPSIKAVKATKPVAKPAPKGKATPKPTAAAPAAADLL